MEFAVSRGSPWYLMEWWQSGSRRSQTELGLIAECSILPASLRLRLFSIPSRALAGARADRIVAEEDSVAVYGKVSGTNTGPMMGTPPTGKRATFAYMDIYRIAGGQVVESWHVEDIAGMLGQLGLMPG